MFPNREKVNVATQTKFESEQEKNLIVNYVFSSFFDTECVHMQACCLQQTYFYFGS